LDDSRYPTHTRYRVVAFMVALAMVTYLDRACIGAMAPRLSAEFDLDAAQMSWVFFAFILAYALFEIPTASWADRRGAKNVLTRIVSAWSVFTFLTAASWNYGALLTARFLFGVGEAGAFPCMARVMSRWIPLRERGTAKGIFFAGAYGSGAITTFAVSALLPHFTWRQILVAFGCAGFIWAIAWHRWFRDDPSAHPAANAAERELIAADRPAESPHPRGFAFWGNLLRERNVRLLCLLYMPNCATFYFCITWLPTYLENQHGFKNTQLGAVSALPLLASVATQFAGGFISDLIRPRFGITAARRVPGFIGYALAAAFILLASAATQPVHAAVFIAIAAAACMLTTAPAWSTCVDIGHEHSATVAATMNTSGQIAAILLQPVVGYSVKWFGNWNVPFWLLAALFVMGALCWLFVEPRRAIYHHADGLIPGSHS
jgi:ACS family glucarate transporter-like MFS transporter